jgi:hypothetical protein
MRRCVVSFWKPYIKKGMSPLAFDASMARLISGRLVGRCFVHGMTTAPKLV